MIHAKKSLGQNFLKSKEALRLILNAGDIKETDIILEIGPGKGALTEVLLQSAKKIIAVEKDKELIEFLKQKFPSDVEFGKLDLLLDDILKFDPEILKNYNLDYKLIANIPYYITGAILKKFLTAEHQPERMVLLLQKEVAQRIVAKDKKESILSLSVKVFGTPKYVKTIQAKYFSPEPKVDSAILLIENISRSFFSENNISEEEFFNLIKHAFAHKRKMLIGNIKNVYPEIDLEKLFQEVHISTKTRAEDLNLEDWRKLITVMAKQKFLQKV
jgi:16S rRNA (adenine1518-N6/adenine1519-N6)-dimethyltransferase